MTSVNISQLSAKSLSSSNISQINNLQCPQHDFGNYVAYCLQDKKLVCLSCMVDEHNKHETLSFDKGAMIERKIQTKLSDSLEPIQEKYREVYEFTDQKSKQLRTQNDIIQQNVSNFFTKMRNSIDNAENDAQDFIEKYINGAQYQLKDIKKKSLSYIKNIKKIQQDIITPQEDIQVLLCAQNGQSMINNCQQELENCEQSLSSLQKTFMQPDFSIDKMVSQLWQKLRILALSTEENPSVFMKYDQNNVKNSLDIKYNGTMFSQQEMQEIMQVVSNPQQTNKKQQNKENQQKPQAKIDSNAKTRRKSKEIIPQKSSIKQQQTIQKQIKQEIQFEKSLKLQEMNEDQTQYFSNNQNFQSFTLKSWDNNLQNETAYSDIYFNQEKSILEQNSPMTKQQSIIQSKQSIALLQSSKNELTPLKDITLTEQDNNKSQQKMQQKVQVKSSKKQAKEKENNENCENDDDTPTRLRKKKAQDTVKRMKEFSDQLKQKTKSVTKRSLSPKNIQQEVVKTKQRELSTKQRELSAKQTKLNEIQYDSDDTPKRLRKKLAKEKAERMQEFSAKIQREKPKSKPKSSQEKPKQEKSTSKGKANEKSTKNLSQHDKKTTKTPTKTPSKSPLQKDARTKKNLKDITPIKKQKQEELKEKCLVDQVNKIFDSQDFESEQVRQLPVQQSKQPKGQDTIVEDSEEYIDESIKQSQQILQQNMDGKAFQEDLNQKILSLRQKSQQILNKEQNHLESTQRSLQSSQKAFITPEKQKSPLRNKSSDKIVNNNSLKLTPMYQNNHSNENSVNKRDNSVNTRESLVQRQNKNQDNSVKYRQQKQDNSSQQKGGVKQQKQRETLVQRQNYAKKKREESSKSNENDVQEQKRYNSQEKNKQKEVFIPRVASIKRDNSSKKQREQSDYNSNQSDNDEIPTKRTPQLNKQNLGSTIPKSQTPTPNQNANKRLDSSQQKLNKMQITRIAGVTIQSPRESQQFQDNVQQNLNQKFFQKTLNKQNEIDQQFDSNELSMLSDSQKSVKISDQNDYAKTLKQDLMNKLKEADSFLEQQKRLNTEMQSSNLMNFVSNQTEEEILNQINHNQQNNDQIENYQIKNTNNNNINNQKPQETKIQQNQDNFNQKKQNNKDQLSKKLDDLIDTIVLSQNSSGLYKTKDNSIDSSMISDLTKQSNNQQYIPYFNQQTNNIIDNNEQFKKQQSEILMISTQDDIQPIIVEKFNINTNKQNQIKNQSQENIKDFACVMLPNKNILLIGGRKNRRVLGTCVEYNYESNTWQDSEIMLSKPKFSTQAIVVENHLIVCGGRDAYNKVLSECEIIDLSTFEQVKELQMMYKRTEFAIEYFEDSVIVFGGFGGINSNSQQEYLKSCEEINIQMDQEDESMTIQLEFEEFPSICMSRAGMQVTNINNKLYVFGGYNGQQYLNSVEKYDPIIQCWTYLTFMNRERAFFSIVKNNLNENEIYLIGGNNGEENMNYVEKYNAEKNRLTILPEIKSAMARHFSFNI